MYRFWREKVNTTPLFFMWSSVWKWSRANVNVASVAAPMK